MSRPKHHSLILPRPNSVMFARVRSDRVRAHSSNFGVASRTLYGDCDEAVAQSALKRLRSQAVAVTAS